MLQFDIDAGCVVGNTEVMPFQAIVDLVRLSPVAQPFLGCSEEEIAQLERQVKLPLPTEYKAFLRFMGHGAGRVLQGSDWLYQDVVQIHQWFEEGELLSLGGLEVPPHEDAFFFFSHQGYVVYYVRTSLGDASPVYQFIEGQRASSFIESDESFLDWLRDSVLKQILVWEFYDERQEIATAPIEPMEQLRALGLLGQDARDAFFSAIGQGIHPLAAMTLVRRLFGLSLSAAGNMLSQIPQSVLPQALRQQFEQTLKDWGRVEQPREA